MLPLCRPLVDVLKHRGIDDPDRYLAPADWSDLPSPFEIEGMEQVAGRIVENVRSGRQLAIFGDYDCDGVLSTAIIQATLRKLGTDPLVHLPHRDDGYGLTNGAVHRFSKATAGLVIAIDNGINASGPIHLARRLGLEVVVVDHHQIETRADAPAVWSTRYCAAGLGLLLSWALLERFELPLARLLPFLRSLCRLAAIASIADCVPLIGPTRTLTRIGLAELAETRHAGLGKLLRMAGVREGAAPTSEQIAFRVAPRINAAGRVGHPKEALDMLNEAGPETQVELALVLDRLNCERRIQEKAAFAELLSMVPSPVPPVLVLYGPQWKKGIAGILASRARERYGIPVFVLVGDAPTGMAVGSGRSVEGLSLIEALRACSSVLYRFGGHDQAAGVTLRAEDIPRFRECLEAFLLEHPPAPMKELVAEAELELELTSYCFYEQLRSMEPFGIGNPTPLFQLRDVDVRAAGRGFVFVRQRWREIKARCAEALTGSGTALVALNGTTATLLRLLRN